MTNAKIDYKLSIAELDIIFEVFADKAVNQEMNDENSDYNWTIAFKAKHQADMMRYPALHSAAKRKVLV